MSSFDLNKFLSVVQKKNFWRNLFWFLLGMFITAVAFNLFYNRYGIMPTGHTGVALLLSKFIPVSISLIILIVGLICLIIGLICFGFDYAFKMLIITFIFPIFVSTTLLITNIVDLEDTSLFLIVVIGGAMYGMGQGLIRKSGYSTGGLCVIFDLMHKYFHISIGIATIIVNAFLIVAAYFIFGVECAMYSLIALLVSSFMLDKVFMGISDNKVFYIITSKPFEVKEYIYEKLHYDVTLVNARGGYTNKKKTMLMSVIPTFDYIKLKRLVREVDKKSFFLIVDTYQTNVKRKL